MTRRTHYIPVGNLQLDGVSIDPAIYCPANGYIFPPDPTVFCPINGYYPLPEDGNWDSPFTEVPDPTTEQIILICSSNTVASALRIYTYNLTNYEVFDLYDNLIDSGISVSNYITYTFPTSETEQHYLFRITPSTGLNLLRFRLSANTTYLISNMNVIEARFYTPYMQLLQSGFYQCPTIRNITFHSTMNDLTGLDGFLQSTPITKFVFPDINFPSLTTLQNFAYGSSLITIDFNNCAFPALLSMENMLINCIDLVYFLNFTPGEAPVNTMRFMFQGCWSIPFIDLSGLIVTSATINIRYAFQQCSVLTEVIMFDTHATQVGVQLEYTCANTTLLKKVTVLGNVKWYQYYFCQTGSNNIREFICAPDMEILTMYSFTYSAGRLETLTLPSNTFCGGYGFETGHAFLKEIINSPTCDTLEHTISLQSPYLPEFNIPTMRIRSASWGTSGANNVIHTVVVDWANSFQTGTYNVNGTYITIYGQLSSASLNAIYNALPTMSVALKLRVSSNPGYAGSDTSVLAAKNWTAY